MTGFSPSSSIPSSGSSGVTVDTYVTGTSNVTVSGTTAGTATTIVTAAAFTADGSSVYCIEFFCYDVSIASGANGFCIVTLNEGATEIGRVVGLNNGSVTAQIDIPAYGKRYITPTAASHTYIIKAYRGTPAVTMNAGDGASGSDNPPPLFVRITHGG